jgi:hypothetical protein
MTLMVPLMKDMPFDPVSMLDDFNTSASGGTRDSTGRNRCADLGDSSSTPASACR